MDEKTIKAIEARNEIHDKISAAGYEFNPDELKEQYRIILEATCEDIIRQRQRLGGNWTVSKELRYVLYMDLF